MMVDPQANNASRGQPNAAGVTAWSRRGRGFHALTAVALSGALLLMVNYLSHRHYLLFDWTRAGYYALSSRTLGLLNDLSADVRVTVFVRPAHETMRDIRNLLAQYQHASRRIRVEYVDPDRDLGRAKELAVKYDLAEANVIIFESGSRRRHIRVRDLMEYDYTPLLSNRPRKKIAFHGEQTFSAAILSVTETRRPRVCFLSGHGERDIHDYRPHEGYSQAARTIVHDDADVQKVVLTPAQGVPDDCDLLIIAGPRQPFSAPEIDRLRAYLNRNGRLMALLDPGYQTNLDPLLEEWGVRVGDDRVIEKAASGWPLTAGGRLGLAVGGRELYVTQYGDHPITRRLRNVTTVFYLPRSVEPHEPGGARSGPSADRPRVTILASCTEAGWAETDPRQDPPEYDAGRDRRGPIGIAAAIEKGAVSGIDVQIRPVRLVVAGDSEFAANGCLTGGNRDFFMNAVNWLLERESLVAVAPKPPDTLSFALTPQQELALFAAAVIGVPGCILILGFLVWLRRRR